MLTITENVEECEHFDLPASMVEKQLVIVSY